MVGNHTDNLLRKGIKLLSIILFAIFVIVAFSIIIGYRINDYNSFIRPTTISWLHGDTKLYDQGSSGFYFMPWSLLLFIPTAWFPPSIGQSILNFLNLSGLLLAIMVFGRGLPIWIKILGVMPFWTFILLIAGNIDCIILLGLCMSWLAIEHRHPLWLSAGLWLASLKPINSLPLLFFAYLLIRSWSWPDRLKAISSLLISLVLSLWVAGPEWPLRYMQYFRETPPLDYPIVTIWKLAGQTGVPFAAILIWALAIIGTSLILLLKHGCNSATFAATMAGWMLVTPYALDMHYSLLLPAFLVVARYTKVTSIAAYITTFLPILRIPYGFDIVTVDLIYPLILWIALLILFLRKGSFVALSADASQS